MKKISSGYDEFFAALGNQDAVHMARRAAEVRSMWEACVDQIFLDHTNAVFIFTENDTTFLVVYVDDSIFGAELNARRELIKLKLLQTFGEKIDEFKIKISRGNYKHTYPFKETKEESYVDSTPAIPLSEEELAEAEKTVESIENPALREKLLKAMVADLEWKKGKNNK